MSLCTHLLYFVASFDLVHFSSPPGALLSLVWPFYLHDDCFDSVVTKATHNALCGRPELECDPALGLNIVI